MESLEKLESSLYEENSPSKDSLFNRCAGRVKSYFTKFSTHGGFYFSGIGCVVGGMGAFTKIFSLHLYKNSNEITNIISKGTLEEKIYGLSYVIGRSAFESMKDAAYWAGVSGSAGYVGGSLMAGRLSEIFSLLLGKSRR